MDGSPPAFGELLRELRRAHGYSLRSFADACHHSKTLIGKWETGGKPPQPDVVEDLDHMLGAVGRLVEAAGHTRPALQRDRIASEVTKHYAHQGPVAALIRQRAAEAQELDVLAVRGLGILALNDSLLWSTLLGRGDTLRARILLLDPDSDAAERRAAEISESTATFVAGIKLAIARLEEVAAGGQNITLDVRLYSSLPVWRIIRVDDLMWVSSFGATWEGHEATIYEVAASPRGSFWSGYRRQFDDMHAHARRII
jgi:transcriptional regulator with XRE-family HTH domain